jgi:HK97 family phage major capsid protein
MDLEKLKELFEAQNKAFEEFKKANDERIAQVEKKGAADPLTEQKVDALNKRLDEVAAQIKKTTDMAEEAAKKAGRLAMTATPTEQTERKHLDEFNLQVRLSYQLKGKAAPAACGIDEYRAYKTAFNKWMRSGESFMDGDERKAMSVGIDAEGGYLVMPDMGGRIVQKIFETSPMRRVAAIQTISTDALEGINDLNEANAGWVAETGSRPATTTPQVGKWRIPVEEMYAMPEATQKLLDDAGVDVEAWLTNKAADKLARVENAGFVTGNGVGKPRGFASYTTAATGDSSRAWGVLEHVATGSNGSFGTDPNGADKLIDLQHRVKQAYREGASWAMNKVTLGGARKLKDTNGSYLWLPAMEARQPSQLLGYPVIEFEDMATYTTTDALAIAFGNFMLGYQIVDRIGIRVLRDPFTNKPYVRFYTTRRVGGDVLHFEAIKFMKFGTT